MTRLLGAERGYLACELDLVRVRVRLRPRPRARARVRVRRGERLLFELKGALRLQPYVTEAATVCNSGYNQWLLFELKGALRLARRDLALITR